MREAGSARVGTVIGRYFAMDRDRRWDRVAARLRPARPRRAPSTTPTTRPAAVRAAYERGETDEFIERDDWSARRRAIRPGDSVIAFNFRPDRMRQITRALAEPGFGEVDRGGGAARVERYATHDRVRGGLALPGRVPARAPERHARRACSRERGARQLHVAETEKYPHVTYFFNGGEETPVRRASGASSCPRRATCRPTTTSRR